ncbi:aspartate/glutamate racemase family protein [Micropruina sp.]|uniref:aspartate/glutamate racemase family protein n=1 Tax=Micropruina sp. TaxID=2737536 RepID=UPI0039E2BF9C
MLIRVINPNTTASMTRSIGRAAERVAAPGVIVQAVNPGSGPASIESHYDEALAVPGIVEEIVAGDAEGVDGYVLACFGDPGLLAAREIAHGPVVGMAEAAMRTAAYLGRSFSVVTTLARTIGRAQDLAVQFGVAQACAGYHAIDLPVLEVDTDPATYASLLEACRRALAGDRSDVIVLGCAGFAGLAPTLQNDLGAPVVDGVAAGVATVRGLIDQGLSTSRVLEFARPPAKEYAGTLSRFAL